MATRTISNTGGNWNATTAWVEAAVPTSADDVVATGTSGNLVVNVSASCRSLNLTNYVGTLSGNADLNIGDATAGAGNVLFKLVAGMTFTYSGQLNFFSTSATQQTFDSGGKTLGDFNFGESNIILAGHLTCGYLTIDGTFNTGNYNITCIDFGMGGFLNVNVTLGSSTITTGTNFNFTTAFATVTMDAGTSTIVLSDTGASTKYFRGAGKTYNNVQITSGGAGPVIFEGDNTFAKLSVTGGSTKTIQFTAGTTTTLTGGTDAFFSGAASNLITIESTSADSAWNLTKASGSVVCDYLSLKDSAASGGATFTPGSNSTNVSGNSGWVFAVPGYKRMSLLGVG